MDREIRFVLKMVDQTRGAIRNITGGLGGTARASAETTKNLKQTNTELEKVRKNTKQARDEMGKFQKNQSLKGLVGQLKLASGQANLLKSALRGVFAGLAGGAALSFGAIFTAGLSEARQFDASLTQIQALTNATREDVEKFRPAVLELSKALGQGPTELADALFVVSSAGVQGADALKLLEASGKAAAAGLGDTADLARVGAAAVFNFGDALKDPSEAIDILTGTAREGNFEVSELAGSIGRALPTAKAAGIDFAEVGGAIAILTRSGLPASEAVSRVDAVFRQLVRQSPQAIKELNTVGLTFQDLNKTIEEDGLLGGLAQLKTAFEGNNAALARFFGDASATNAFLALTADLDTTAAAFDGVAASIGSTQEAFDTVSKSSSQRIKKAFNEIRVALTQIAATTLPAVASALEGLAASIPVISAAVQGLAVALGGRFLIGAAVGAVGALAQLPAVLTAARAGFVALNLVIRANPIGLLITVIQIAVAAFITFSGGVDKAADNLKNAFSAAVAFVSNLFKVFVDRLRGVISGIVNVFRNLAKGDFEEAGRSAGKAAGDAFALNFVSVTKDAFDQTRKDLANIATAAAIAGTQTGERFVPGSTALVGDAAAAGAERQATEQTQRRSIEVDNLIAKLSEEMRIAGLSNREREIATRLEQELNGLREKGVVLTAGQETEIEKAISKLIDQEAATKKIEAAQKALNELRKRGVEQADDAIQALRDQATLLRTEQGERARITALQKFQNQLEESKNAETAEGVRLLKQFKEAFEDLQAAQREDASRNIRQGLQRQRDELQLLRLSGREREIIAERLQFQRQLEEEGLANTAEGNALLQEFLATQQQIVQAQEAAKRNAGLGVREALDSIRDSFTDLRSQFRDLTTDFTNNLVDSIDQFVATGKGGFRSLLADFGAQLRRLGIQQVIGGIIGQVQGGVGNLFGGQQQRAPGLGGGGAPGGATPVFVTNGPGGLGGAGDNFVSQIQGDFQKTSQGFAQAAGTSGTGGFLGSIGGVFSGLVNGLGGIAGGLVQGLSGIFSSILGGIGGLFGGGGGFGGLFSGIFGAFGFAQGGIMTQQGPAPLPKVNFYRDGGIASSPQLAVFGEGSRPEAFVPLPDGRTIPVTMNDTGSGRQVVNNINITTPDADSFRKAMPQIAADLAAMTARQGQRNN